jgi:hypothetical protein
MRKLPGIPEDDPRNRLSYAARCRIEDAFDAGSKARDAAVRAYRDWRENPDSKLALDAAVFDYAFQVLSAELAEFRAIGMHGEELRSAMAYHIEWAVGSLELSDYDTGSLTELLMHEWGW